MFFNDWPLLFGIALGKISSVVFGWCSFLATSVCAVGRLDKWEERLDHDMASIKKKLGINESKSLPTDDFTLVVVQQPVVMTQFSPLASNHNVEFTKWNDS